MPSERKLQISNRCVYYLKDLSKKCCKDNFLVLSYVENPQPKDLCANICVHLENAVKEKKKLPKKSMPLSKLH